MISLLGVFDISSLGVFDKEYHIYFRLNGE
jgi:hypothetical protein